MTTLATGKDSRVEIIPVDLFFSPATKRHFVSVINHCTEIKNKWGEGVVFILVKVRLCKDNKNSPAG